MATDLALLPPGTKRNRPRPAQLQGVESPATVLLHPVAIGQGVQWWAHANSSMLVGGLELSRIEDFKGGTVETAIGYLPSPVPRSWERKEFRVVIEYESEHKGNAFQIRLYYGCGDPSELRVGESQYLTGKSYGRDRMAFALKAKYLDSNELFRATVAFRRITPHPILIYGAWLEIGVED